MTGKQEVVAVQSRLLVRDSSVTASPFLGTYRLELTDDHSALLVFPLASLHRLCLRTLHKGKFTVYVSKARLMYSPVLAPTTRLNALPNAASDS